MSLNGVLTEKCSGADFDPADFDPSDFETEAYGLTAAFEEKQIWLGALAEKQSWSGNFTVKEP